MTKDELIAQVAADAVQEFRDSDLVVFTRSTTTPGGLRQWLAYRLIRLASWLLHCESGCWKGFTARCEPCESP